MICLPILGDYPSTATEDIQGRERQRPSMSTEETAAERRARLRRMKILADSEKRLGRIIYGDSGGGGGGGDTAPANSSAGSNGSSETSTTTSSTSGGAITTTTTSSSSSTSKDCDSQVWSSVEGITINTTNSSSSSSSSSDNNQQHLHHHHHPQHQSPNTDPNDEDISSASLQREMEAFFQVSSWFYFAGHLQAHH